MQAEAVKVSPGSRKRTVVLVGLLALACLLTAYFVQRWQEERPFLQAAAKGRIGECGCDPLPTAGALGLSGLAGVVEHGVWALAESGTVLRYETNGNGWCLRERIDDLHAKLGIAGDFESIAQLGDSQLAFGLESPYSGEHGDDIVVAARKNGKWSREFVLSIDYAAWPGLEHPANRGVEGLCSTPEWLVFASERVFLANGKRFGPLGFWHRATKTWGFASRELRSDEGKVSSIECREEGNGRLMLWAIERHFATMWLHQIRLANGDVKSDQVISLKDDNPVDLAPCRRDEATNFEGLWYDGKELWLVNDNHYGRATTFTRALRLGDCPLNGR
jgi:hypothetical protein